MKVVCPACNARYRLPDDRVRGKVLKIRCKSCGHIFQVRDPNTKATDSASIRSRSTRATGAFGAVDDPRKTDSTTSQPLETSAGSFSNERIWYYSINGESYGPYRESELFARFQGGRIGSEAYVWTEGFEKWKLATEEATFNDALAASAERSADLEKKTKAPAEPKTTKAKRAPRDRRASKTMSLSAVQLNEQLQDERSEDEVAENEPSPEPAATQPKAETKAPASKPKTSSADGQLRDTLSSDSFGDEVEDALDQMFGGGDSPKPDTKSAAVETPKKTQTTSASQAPKEPAATKSAAGGPKSKPQAEKKPKTDLEQPSEEVVDTDDGGGDSLSSLKSFLAASRKERRRRTEKNVAIVVPDDSDDTPEGGADEAQSAAVTEASVEAETHDIDRQDAEAATPAEVDDDSSADQIEEEEAAKPAPRAESTASKKTAGSKGDDRDDDESIDLSDLLGGDLTGTGFGTETAAHAAIEEPKSEPASSRKSNIPLVLIIIILLLGIVFVVVELTGDDEPTEPTVDEQTLEESTIGPANTPNRGLSQAEIRDRRLCISSAKNAVVFAAGEAAKAAFLAVPDEIRNPEAARRAQALANRTVRTPRDGRQEQIAQTPPPRLDDPGVAFAQPTLGRRDDSGAGPSRQAFANGLNTFVQQSVFECQQVHMRREGELAIARVAVSIRVNPNGTVAGLSVPPQIAATAFATCLQSKTRNWRFNPFAGDSVVIERTYIIQ